MKDSDCVGIRDRGQLDRQIPQSVPAFCHWAKQASSSTGAKRPPLSSAGLIAFAGQASAQRRQLLQAKEALQGCRSVFAKGNAVITAPSRMHAPY